MRTIKQVLILALVVLVNIGCKANALSPEGRALLGDVRPAKDSCGVMLQNADTFPIRIYALGKDGEIVARLGELWPGKRRLIWTSKDLATSPLTKKVFVCRMLTSDEGKFVDDKGGFVLEPKKGEWYLWEFTPNSKARKL